MTSRTIKNPVHSRNSTHPNEDILLELFSSFTTSRQFTSNLFQEPSLPLPLDPNPPTEADEKRLWIGNLDNRVTEFCLVKILKTCGKVEKFDFLFHKSGPLKGQPRGYCFVTFEQRSDAQAAVAKLNGKQILNRCIAVKWAHNAPPENMPSKKNAVLVPPPQSSELKTPNSLKHQISAIEAKLKAMENGDDFDMDKSISAQQKTVTAWPSNQQSCRPAPYHRKEGRRQQRRR